MQNSKKIIIYTSIAIIALVMLSLFYYSMRATLIDYFFENDQALQEKLTSASSDQAQIMVDLANKQLAKEQEDTKIREDEAENQSLFKELSGSKATVKETTDKLVDARSNSGSDALKEPKELMGKKPNQVENGFVVIDCDKGAVIACPHYEVQTGTSPLFYLGEKSHFVVGRCVDVSIDTKTFCP